MMELEITQPLFERYVPAFRSPTGRCSGRWGLPWASVSTAGASR